MINRQSTLALPALTLFAIAALLGVGIYLVQQSSTPEPEAEEIAWQPAPAVTASTTPTTAEPGKAGALSEMVIGLEQRLHQQGGTAEDWVLLGKTYQYLRRTEDAEIAYSKAEELGYAADKLSNARAAMAQQMAASVPRLAPPDNTMNALDVAAMNQTLSKNTTTSQASIQGTLTLSPTLQSQLPVSATLFIFARDAKQAGAAPLAVIRTQNVQFPLSFQLNDSHAVVPGRTLSSASTIVIGARLTRSGNASGQPGDFEGFSQPMSVGDNSAIRLEIDKIRQ